MVEARKSAAAGVYYPSEPATLASAVRGLLDAVPPFAGAQRVPRPRAIVAPHGSYQAAGPALAAAWARAGVGAERFRRAVLFGPAHHVPFAGVAAPFADAFATPLGVVPVDRIAIETMRRFPQLVVFDEPHDQERSLDVHIPFVQTVLPHASIVPLLVGQGMDAAAACVLDALWTEDTLVVVSTDLSRYHDVSTATALDEVTACAIEALNGAAIDEGAACGCAALRALLLVARARRLSAARVDLRHSGNTADNPTEVVGFGAFVLGEGVDLPQ